VSKPKNGAMHWSVTRPKEQIPRGPEVRSEWYEVREWDDFTGCEKVWCHTSGAKARTETKPLSQRYKTLRHPKTKFLHTSGLKSPVFMGSRRHG